MTTIYSLPEKTPFLNHSVEVFGNRMADFKSIFYSFYRERNENRVPILMALTDKKSLEFHLRMPIYIPNFGRRGQEII